MFGCEPESPISQIVAAELTDGIAADGSTVIKPQRAKGSSWTLANTTVSSEDTVMMRIRGTPGYRYNPHYCRCCTDTGPWTSYTTSSTCVTASHTVLSQVRSTDD